jgi:hypothetical protein
MALITDLEMLRVSLMFLNERKPDEKVVTDKNFR